MIIKSFQLQTEFNFLLINITLSQLIMSIYGVPVDFVAALQLGWKLGKEFCLMTGFLLTFLGMYIINIFTSIAIYRWIFAIENVSLVSFSLSLIISIILKEEKGILQISKSSPSG